MANEPKIRRTPLISTDLMKIAQSEGEPHLLDSDTERAQASALIEESILERERLENIDNVSDCEIDIFEEAQNLLEDGERLQANPLYADILNYRCRGVSLLGHYFLFDTVDVELLSEIEGNEHSSYYVFHHGGGWRTQLEEETLTAVEWNVITSPFSALGFRGYGSECDIDAAHEAADEREALAYAISLFERVIGPKAGTARDIGGLIGNSRIDVAYEMGMEFRNRGAAEASGQQDCINETQTTRQFIALLIQQGLVVYHMLDPNDSIVSLENYGHHAIRLVELGHPEAIAWSVDSWVESNGHPPEILPASAWFAKWEQIFGPK